MFLLPYRAIFVWPWKMVSASVRYLFYQQMDEKIKTLTLPFPARENPDMEMHCLIGQSCCSMTSKQSIDWFLESSRAWSFSPERSLNQPKAMRVVSFRSTNQIALFPFVCCFVLFARFHFKVIRKSLYRCIPLQPPSVLFTLIHGIWHFIPFTAFFDGNSIGFDSIHCLFHSNLFHSIYCLFSVKFHSIPLHCSLSIKAIPISFIV